MGGLGLGTAGDYLFTTTDPAYPRFKLDAFDSGLLARQLQSRVAERP